MHDSTLRYRSEESGSHSMLSQGIVDLDSDRPARNIRRPQVAKARFSRTAAQAAAQDGVDTSVTVRRIGA